MFGLILATMLGTAQADIRVHVHVGQPNRPAHAHVPAKRHAHRDHAHHNRHRPPAARPHGTWIWVRGHWARCHGHSYWVKGHWSFRIR